MKLLENLPQTAFFLGIFLFSCLFAYLPFIAKVILIAAAVLLLLLSAAKVFGMRNSLRILCIVSLASVIISGIISVVCFDVTGKICSDAVGKTETVTVEITECEYSLSYAASYRAKILSSDSLPKGTGILLSSQLTSLKNGTVLTGEVTFSEIEDLGSFDAERYYLPQKIRLAADDISLEKSGSRTRFSVTGFFTGINEWLCAKISAHVRYDAAGIASAVLLGNRDELADSTVRDFRRLGISHLLVISGTHFSVIVSSAEKAMRRLLLTPRKRAAVNILIVILFMFLTGFTPSVVRAGIMHILAQCSLIVLRKPVMIHSFALSGAIMVLANPCSAVDCGMLLSFIATYVCIMFQPNSGLIRRMLRKKGIRVRSFPARVLSGLVDTVILTSLITLNTLPVMWLYFGEVSLISIPVNVIFIPAVTFLMYLTGVYLLLYPIGIFVYPIASVISLYCMLIEKIAEFFSKLNWVLVPVNYSFSVFFLIPLAVLLVMIPIVTKNSRKYILLSAALLSVSFISVIGICTAIDRSNTYFSYLPDKGNDGFVLKSEGKALICDISDASYSYIYNLTDEVSALHSCEIEALMLTHYHSKHVSLLERLAQREILRSVILPEPIDEREAGIYSSLLESAELYGVETAAIPIGGSYEFGDAVITQLNRTYISRSTHPITAVQIDIGEETAVIASCSFNQAGEDIADALEDADYPIFGRHSPVYKKAFSPDLSEAKAVMISEDAAVWMSEDTFGTIADGAAYIAPESFRMKVSRLNTVSTEAE